MSSSSVLRKDQLMQQAISELHSAGIEDAPSEAHLLLEWVLAKDRLAVLNVTTIGAEEAERYRQAVTRRARREPFAFITGEQGFWTLDLSVSTDTLIPRADSEALIEALLRYGPDHHDALSILDLGTGTGCLLLAALSEYSQATGWGVDISEGAVRLARHNARRNGLDKRASFTVGSWADGITERFDVILSNPPYIEHDSVAKLMPEVGDYEPHRALDGGKDGLGAYRLLCRELPRLLSPKGCAIFELGIHQEDAVTALAEEQGFRKIACHADLGGVPRALVLGWA